MMLYLCRMSQFELHELLWSYIGIHMRILATEPRRTAEPLFSSQVSLWNHLSDPVFDSVGLAGFKSRVNVFLLA